MIARASQWTVEEVRRAVSGDIAGPTEAHFDGVSTDTRDALRGQLFVALRGERFDAHDFLDRAVEGGAAGLLVDRSLDPEVAARLAASTSIISVADTLVALGDLARAHRRRCRTKIFALTGSNGKTTTKEMVAAIFAESRSVLKTAGNLNNLIGGPMTLLGLTEAHAVAVIEMGMNAPGEIARLAEIAEPHAGLITNVGPAHIGELGSIAAIGRAKGELYTALTRLEGVAVVNADDRHVVQAVEESGTVARRTFGTGAGVDVKLEATEPTDDGQKITLQVDGRSLSVSIPYPGQHNAMNAAAAVALATVPLRGVSPVTDEQIAGGLGKAAKIAGRLQAEQVGGISVVDDCYNANAASMLAAIETVATQVARRGGRFVALLGEMRELGGFCDVEHARVGEALATNGAALAAVFGPLAGPLAGAAAEGGVTCRHEAEDADRLWDWLAPQLTDGDVVLVKGSRGIRMERFIERLLQRGR